MSRLLVSVLSLLLLLPAGLVEARTSPLAIPGSVPVPPSLARDLGVCAIELAPTARAWLIEDEAGGRIETGVDGDAHSARFAVERDAREIRVRHIDRSKLEEPADRNGRRPIRRNHNSWLALIPREIRLKLQEGSI